MVGGRWATRSCDACHSAGSVLNHSITLAATLPKNSTLDWVQQGALIAAGSWTTVGDMLDYSVLCDEAGKGEGANFTGAFVGMCCQDLTGTARHADFPWFEYQERGAGPER